MIMVISLEVMLVEEPQLLCLICPSKAKGQPTTHNR